MIKLRYFVLAAFLALELPISKRKLQWQKFLNSLLEPIQVLGNEYGVYQQVQRTKCLVSAEIASLNWYLEDRLQASIIYGDPIYISDTPVTGQGIGRMSEAASYVVMGAISEPTSWLAFEDNNESQASFIVNIPTAANGNEKVDQIISYYKPAGQSYIYQEY